MQETHPGSIPGLGRSAGEGISTHSSILAWEILWAEKPGGLQSTGVKHDLVTNTYTVLFIYWLHWVFVAARGISIVAESGGCSLVVVLGLLIVVASLVAEREF